MTEIGKYAFDNCRGLTTINYNAVACADFNGGNIWGNYVFTYAGKDGDGITVNIGANVTKIPAYIFCPDSETYNGSAYSPKITAVVFTKGSKCTSIGTGAFKYCSSITTVYYGGTESDWNSISIGSSNTYLTSATRHYGNIDVVTGG